MPYSEDLRQKLLHAVQTGTQSKAALAELFGVSQSFLYSLLRLQRQTGQCSARPHGGGVVPTLTESQQAALRTPLRTHPALLRRELVDWWREQHQVSLSVSGLCRLLQRMGLPRNKACGTPPNATRLRISSSVPSGVPKSIRSSPLRSSLSMKAG